MIATAGLTRNAGAQYIVDHYNELPRWMVFVHGHNSSEHMPDKVSVLRVSSLQSKAPSLYQQLQHHLYCSFRPGLATTSALTCLPVSSGCSQQGKGAAF